MGCTSWRVALEFFGKRILDEISASLGCVSEDMADNAVDCIVSAARVFTAGNGRSGLIVRSFAMRLMHLGFDVHVVGDVTTPSINSGDLLIIASGSGETGSLIGMSKKAKEVGAKLILFTTAPESSIAAIADFAVIIPAQTKHSNNAVSVQPMGSLFEQTLLIVFDEMVLRLIKRRNTDLTKMRSRHANLE
jgi:6-phospho-3-hexuloisomerase